MRRLFLVGLAWCITALPIAAQNYNGQNQNLGLGSSFDEQFSTPPPVMNININDGTGNFRQVPQPAPTRFEGSGGATTFVTQLAPRDFQVLSSRDIVVLIDKSGSMSEADCPPPRDGLRRLSRWGGPSDPVSRWDWCEQELIRMSRIGGSAFPQGIRVVLYSTGQTNYENVHISQIPEIFSRNNPSGSTNAAPALKAQLDRYFANKARMSGRVRPLAIAVITDGLPNNVRALKKAIIEASQSMQHPQEIAVTFLQVGMDKSGVRLVHELDDQLPQEGAVFDIVDCKDFGDLMRVGLARALVDAVSEAAQVSRNR